MATVGPYELVEIAGRGGMCDVWRAQSAAGTNVAVKLLRPEFPAELLRREVEHTARMNHRGIVGIHGWGEVTRVEATDSPELLAQGSPWVAMEYVAGGSLTSEDAMGWDDFRSFAVQILDALMHAHARGLVHRDIKPGNVLVARRPDGPRYVLTDFGIAFASRTQRRSALELSMAGAGTPVYMSPEQIAGKWREFGRHTDLFCLGVMLYERIFGRLPFEANSGAAMMMAQSRGPMLEGPTMFPIPEGLKGWLARMLRYQPSSRFSFAAHAAHEFLRLERVSGAGRRALSRPHVDVPTLAIPEDWKQEAIAADAEPVQVVRPTLKPGETAPLAEDWRTGEDDGMVPIEAIGLQWFGLRTVGMIGREELRDALWGELRAAIESRAARIAVVRGPYGMGASRVARWLCERASELGVADQARVRPVEGGLSIPGIVEHELGLQGLERARRMERVTELLGDANIDLERLVDLTLARPMSFASQRGLVTAMVGAIASRTPLVIWLDDAHRDTTALDIALALRDVAIPLLVVLTVDSDSVANSPYEAERLAELPSFEVSPLEATEMQRFVDHVAGPEGAVRARLVEAASGSPLRALLLLELSALGFDLGDVIELDLEGLWWQIVASVLDATQIRALLAAAVLGDAFRRERWRDLCAACDIPVSEDLVQHFVATRLWSGDENYEGFAHGSLRDAVMTNAGAGGAVEELHCAAASLFDATGHEGLAARHLILGGATERGMARMYETVRADLESARFPRAEARVRWAERQLHDPGPAERIWLRLARETILLRKGETPADGSRAHALGTEAVSLGIPALAAEAFRLASFFVPDLDASRRLLDSAYEQALAAQDARVTGRVCHRRARVELGAKNFAESVRWSEEAIDVGGFATRFLALDLLALVYLEMGLHTKARETLLRAVEDPRFSETSDDIVVHLYNTFAELERRCGDLAAADACMETAVRFMSHALRIDAAIAKLNYAALKLERGLTADARSLVADAVRIGFDGHDDVAMHAEAVLVWVSAQDGDVEGWSERVDARILALRGSEYASFWEKAAESWIEHQRPELALKAVDMGLAAVPVAVSDIAARLKTLRKDLVGSPDSA